MTLISILKIVTSVVTVAGICTSVCGGVFLTCHRSSSGGGKCRRRWVSRLKWLMGKQVDVVASCSGCPGIG